MTNCFTKIPSLFISFRAGLKWSFVPMWFLERQRTSGRSLTRSWWKKKSRPPRNQPAGGVVVHLLVISCSKPPVVHHSNEHNYLTVLISHFDYV